MADSDEESLDRCCLMPQGQPPMPARGLSLAALRLEPDVEQKARQLQQNAPTVIFTSGRRDVTQQAAAMADNVMLNRHWIAQTYRATLLVTRLQSWVNAHPNARTREAVKEGLLSVLTAAPPAEMAHLSRHLIGRAFDVVPHSCSVSAIEALAPAQFLQHEGGLARWHIDF